MTKINFLVNNALLVGLIGLCAFFAAQASTFLTVGNVKNIAVNSSILAVVVVPLAMLVIAGQLDLSVGSNVGLTAVITCLAVLNWHFGVAAAMILGILVGGGVGAVNGLLCAVLGFSPIIVTLGMLGAIRGATLLITDQALFGLGGVFTTLGSGEVVGVPVLVLFAAGAFLLGSAFLTLTPWGRHVYAVGVNPQAAYLSGLAVRALPFWLYVATGACCGIAGILFASRLGGASPADVGIGMEISALTAILLGGVAFAGGRGKLSTVFVAVVFLGVLQDGLVLMNVAPFVEQLAQGLVLVAAAGLDVAAMTLTDRVHYRTQVARQLSESEAAPAPARPQALASAFTRRLARHRED
jgi:ribose/xylose/arabinose/galactoside ABC-type transport system permease subunit